MSSSVKSYVFTINNPEPDRSLPTYVPFHPEDVSTLVYQLEQGTSGTLHLQGYIEFTVRRNLAQCKEYPGLARAHLEVKKK